MQIIEKFKSGHFNVLVSTCVGEEGLDIGEVDLIVNFDTPKSLVRLIQRAGRTGRKRQGVVHAILTAGKEERVSIFLRVLSFIGDFCPNL